MIRPVAVVLALALSALVGACGVREQSDVETVPPGQLPAELRAPARGPASPGAGAAVVYLVERDRLVPQLQVTARSGVDRAVDSLLNMPAQSDDRRTAIPAGTELRAMTVRGDLVRVDLNAVFRKVRGRDQLLAVAQLVWTLTEAPDIRRVRLAVEGVLIQIPTDGGVVPSRDLTRQDFRSVAPLR